VEILSCSLDREPLVAHERAGRSRPEDHERDWSGALLANYSAPSHWLESRVEVADGFFDGCRDLLEFVLVDDFRPTVLS